MGLIASALSLVLAVFWFFMMLDMVVNKRIKREDKVLWLIGFIFLSILTACYYYFTKYDRSRAWWR